MRRFQLERSLDPLGISGTGAVAEGVEFRDGAVHMQWVSGPVRSFSLYASMDECRAITCADVQRSRIVYLDPEPYHIPDRGVGPPEGPVDRFTEYPGGTGNRTP